METTKSCSGGFESKIEEFCREINSAEEGANYLSAIVQVQTFRHLAGFKPIHTQDKWLNRISINSSLSALGCGVTQLYDKLQGKNSLESNLIIGNLLLETHNCNNELLEKILMESMKMDDPRITHLYNKSMKMTVNGATVVSIFKKEPQILKECLEEMKGKSGETLQKFWLMRSASECAELYNYISSVIQTANPTFLPDFIHNAALLTNIVKFYPPHEQPCVILTVLPEEIHHEGKDLHIAKVMEELLELWLIDKLSVVKLLSHFPQIVEWLMEYCHIDNNAKRLCLHFFNNPNI